MMVIGVDFDNTLVSYDGLFHSLALERGLIGPDVGADKDSVRDHLRRAGREDAWTELQGYGYGPGMADAKPVPGALEFLKRWRARGVPVHVISHRTPKPYLGPAYDLHAAARAWLERHGVPRESVHLEPSKEAKLGRIAQLGCTHFIDDLPEFLEEPGFPAGVERILFDPAGRAPERPGLRGARSWDEIEERLAQERRLFDSAEALVRRTGAAGTFRLAALAGAANNRVFRAEAGDKRYLLKAYFRHAGDPRDRLAAEFSFAKFAWSKGVRRLPEPIASDPADGIALYGFVEGRRLGPADATPERVREAAGFFAELNQHRSQAKKLPTASEACFSIAEHLELIGGRVERLRGLDPEEPAGKEALAFVKEELTQAWEEARRIALAGAHGLGLGEGEPLCENDRCVSPSDFGFHNALLAADGKLRFIDFEYAGMDDPAKMLCDFFLQPAVPAPLSERRVFAELALAPFADSRGLLERADVLRDAYRIKWCCILLNDFLPVGAARRRFAGALGSTDLIAQLGKARRLLRQELT